jgi:hypothetical protein
MAPSFGLLALTIIGIRWPRRGGWVMIGVGAGIFVWWLNMSDLSAGNVLLAFLLGGITALVGVLFRREARRQERLRDRGWTPPEKWHQRNRNYLLGICIPVAMMIAVSAYWAPILLNRVDDGDRGARLIEGNGVTLVWAPEGPGWYQHYYSWNDLAFYGVSPVGFGEKPGLADRDATIEDMNATGLCCYLAEDGVTIMDEPQYIWRMPTVDEIVRSLVIHGENAGCTWDGESRRADCAVRPDKETPLWAPDWSPIYYWAADEYDEHRAYYVSYNGEGVNYQPKSWGNSRHGYRFVREP